MGLLSSLKKVETAVKGPSTFDCTDDMFTVNVTRPFKATIIADNEGVTIKRFGALQSMNGNSGEITIPYTELSGVKLFPKKMLLDSYIEFLSPAVSPVTDRKNIPQYPNAVSFYNEVDMDVFEQLKSFVQGKKAQAISPVIQQSQVSSADEILKFKSLLDAGVITEAEFETKKQELLK